MGETVSTVVTNALKRYPDMNDGGTFCLSMLQQVWDDLLGRHPLVLDTENFNVTADDPTITLTATILRIWTADYVRSATAGDVKRLKPVSIKWMDTYKGRWRDHASGEPSYYMIDEELAGTTALRLYRKPNLTTTSSYPVVRTQVTRKQTLTTSAPGAGEINDFPECLSDPMVLLEGAWARYTKFYVPENAEGHQRRYEALQADLAASLKLFVAEDVPILAPGWAQTAMPTT